MGLDELVLKLNLKIQDAKIVIPFINEILNYSIKIELPGKIGGW